MSIRCANGYAVGGDAAVVRECGDRVILAMIDVLGHGPEAHIVAARAESLVRSAEARDAGLILAALDAGLAGTPGAAAGVAHINVGSGEGCFAGVGNTVARVFARGERRLLSVDGVVGKRHPSTRPVEFRIDVGDTLVLHSDGISSRFSLSDWPQLPVADVEAAARQLVRLFGKDQDDAACIVARRSA
jgi:hypothetical protein